MSVGAAALSAAAIAYSAPRCGPRGRAPEVKTSPACCEARSPRRVPFPRRFFDATACGAPGSDSHTACGESAHGEIEVSSPAPVAAAVLPALHRPRTTPLLHRTAVAAATSNENGPLKAAATVSRMLVSSESRARR